MNLYREDARFYQCTAINISSIPCGNAMKKQTALTVVYLSKMRKKSLKCKLQHFNVLIIDEISMVENCEDALLGGVSLLAVGNSSVFASPYSCLGSNDS